MALLNPLSPYMFWAKIAGVLILCAGSAAGTYYVKDNVDGRKYTALELKQSQAETKNVQASLDQLQGFITNMHTADADYTGSLQIIAQNLQLIKKEVANATVKPLPTDCKPDVGRVRVLTDAVAKANAGAGLIP
jgi:hypothetical protein